MKGRCGWAVGEKYELYHDIEWGVPVHDDRVLFEFLILEGAQAGLSWSTILNKREGYRNAFSNFDPKRVAQFDAKKIAELMLNPNIVRNRLKIDSAISNARAFLEIQRVHGTFDAFVWGLVGGSPRHNHWKLLSQIPASSAQSDHMSKVLKKAGFRFVGSTICYAFMQAVGMVNDHLVTCPRHAQLGGASTQGRRV